VDFVTGDPAVMEVEHQLFPLFGSGVAAVSRFDGVRTSGGGEIDGASSGDVHDESAGGRGVVNSQLSDSGGSQTTGHLREELGVPHLVIRELLVSGAFSDKHVPGLLEHLELLGLGGEGHQGHLLERGGSKQVAGQSLIE